MNYTHTGSSLKVAKVLAKFMTSIHCLADFFFTNHNHL